ncbi:MAG: hypothetical protein IJZ79_03635 [Bacilli bacterium]|nr:hypothetical protein [Bacilli bacterium]MBQ8218821.1 hypothetical protein [Bacilli bacterium]
MKRDPIERQMNQYYNSIHIRKIRPKFSYHRCTSCGQEFKKVPMYECSYPDDYFSMTHHVIGCSECFDSIESFKQYMYDNYIVSKDFWEHNGKMCIPLIKKMLLAAESNPTISSNIANTAKNVSTSIKKNTSLFIVEDGNYKIAVRATDWNEAKEKAIKWSTGKYSLRLDDIGVSICDNEEVVY